MIKRDISPRLALLVLSVAFRGKLKRFLCLTPIIFVLISATASADSFRILLLPNDGSGDNFIVQKQVAGANILVNGGTPPAFFSTFYEPGSTIGGTTQVFFSNGTVLIGGTSFDLTFSAPGTLFLSSFTLPTNGKDFTVLVQLRFAAQGVVIDTGQNYDLGGNATGLLSFHFENGFYFTDPAGFIQTPEAGTLELVGTGLIGLFALARKRLRL